MRALLKDAGYSQSTCEGARVRKIKGKSGRLIMPYVDHISQCEIGSEFITLGDGETHCQETSGLLGRQTASYTCDHCGDAYSEDDDEAGGGYCGGCNENRSSCDNCQESYWNDALTSVGGDYLCEDCAREAETVCEACSDRFQEDNLSRILRQSRERDHMQAYCTDCAPLYRYCPVCEHHSDIESPTCETESCAYVFPVPDTLTAPLPLESPAEYVQVLMSPDRPPITVALYPFRRFHRGADHLCGEAYTSISDLRERQSHCCRIAGHSGPHSSIGEVAEYLGGHTDRVHAPSAEEIIWLPLPSDLRNAGLVPDRNANGIVFIPTVTPDTWRCAQCAVEISSAQRGLSMALADNATPACQDCVTAEFTRVRELAEVV
jgi:hypothetical protein